LFKGWKEKQAGNYLSGRQRRFLLSGLLCLLLAGVYTGVSTVAWFTQDIKSANKLEIGVFAVNGTLTNPSMSTFSARGGGMSVGPAASVVEPGFYRLNVQAVGNSSGYCLIYLKATTSDFPQAVYYSDQMGRSGEASYGYDLLINEPTSIRVISVWQDMEGADPLRNDEYISYGRPPVVVKPEEEEEQTETEGGDTQNSSGSASESTSTGSDTSGSTSTGSDISGGTSIGSDTSGSTSTGNDTSGGTSTGNDTSGGTSIGNDTSGSTSTGIDSSGSTSSGNMPAESTFSENATADESPQNLL